MIHDPHHTHGAVTFIHQNKKLFIINLQSSFSLALDCSFVFVILFVKIFKIFNNNKKTKSLSQTKLFEEIFIYLFDKQIR